MLSIRFLHRNVVESNGNVFSAFSIWVHWNHAEKDKSAAQLKYFLIILKIFPIVYLDYLRVCIKVNKLPYLMCEPSRFFTLPLPTSPVGHGAAVSGHLRTQWEVAGCGYRKKDTTSIIRVNWDPWNHQLSWAYSEGTRVATKHRAQCFDFQFHCSR